jgi:hypothetical protein
MGHFLGASIMHRASTAVAGYLTANYGDSVFSYLDDWLIWDGSEPQVNAIN